MITLVLGGARSGKSEVAERIALASAGDRVTYVATWVPGHADEDMDQRIALHRGRRPAAWALVEVGQGVGLPDVLRAIPQPVLVDSLGTWVACTPDFVVDPGALCAALQSRTSDSIVVSEEVGMGVHPPTAVGREFRDVLGAVNEAVAEIADRVLLVVAGRVLPLDRFEDLAQ